MLLFNVRTGDLDLSWGLCLIHHVSALICHVSAYDYVLCIVSPVMQWEAKGEREMPLNAPKILQVSPLVIQQTWCTLLVSPSGPCKWKHPEASRRSIVRGQKGPLPHCQSTLRNRCRKNVWQSWPWKIMNVGIKKNIKMKMNLSCPRFCGSRSLWEDSGGAVRVGR